MKLVNKTSFEHGIGAPPSINDQRGQGAFWSYFYFLCMEFKKKKLSKIRIWTIEVKKMIGKLKNLSPCTYGDNKLFPFDFFRGMLSIEVSQQKALLLRIQAILLLVCFFNTNTPL